MVCLPTGSQVPVSGATVTVNGESLPELFGNLSFNLLAVAPGQNVTLHFVYQDIDILKTLVMPNKPDITTLSAAHDATGGILIEWNLVNPPLDNITVSVSSSYTKSPNGYTAVLSNTATGHTIPANTLKTSQISIPVIVEAMNQTTNLGSSVISGSVYQVGNQDEVEIETN